MKRNTILINYTLLLCSARFAGLNVNRWRILASAILGGFASLLIFLPTPNIALQMVIKLVVTILMLLIAYKTNTKGYLKGFGWYIAFNCLLAGLVMLFYFTGGNGVIMRNMQLYFDISAVFLVACTLVLYICATAIRMVFVVPDQKPKRIELLYKGTISRLNACYDSGFTAKDILNNAPLIILDYNSCKEQLSPAIRTIVDIYFSTGVLEKGASVLPLNSIGGSELTITFYPITIKCDNKTVDKIKLCISKNNIDINGVNCLLSKEFMEVQGNAIKTKVHN